MKKLFIGLSLFLSVSSNATPKIECVNITGLRQQTQSPKNLNACKHIETSYALACVETASHLKLNSFSKCISACKYIDNEFAQDCVEVVARKFIYNSNSFKYIKACGNIKNEYALETVFGLVRNFQSFVSSMIDVASTVDNPNSLKASIAVMENSPGLSRQHLKSAIMADEENEAACVTSALRHSSAGLPDRERKKITRACLNSTLNYHNDMETERNHTK